MKRSILIMAALLVARAALAADVGVPAGERAGGAPNDVEFHYEHFSRNISQDYISGPATGDQEENRYVARYERRVLGPLRINVSAGMTQSDVAENVAPLVGVGARFSVFSSDTTAVGLFASGAYVDGIEYHSKGFVATGEGGERIEQPDVEQTESYLEVAGGAGLSRRFVLSRALTCAPYGGLMVSKIQGDEDYRLTWRGEGRTETVGGEIRESGLPSLFAGLAFTWRETWRLRVEGRYLNQASFSTGLGCAF